MITNNKPKQCLNYYLRTTENALVDCCTDQHKLQIWTPACKVKPATWISEKHSITDNILVKSKLMQEPLIKRPKLETQQ